MARHSLAASLLLLASENVRLAAAASEPVNTEAWTYLTVKTPTPLSDMSVVVLSTGGGDDGAEAKRRIILTGGCDDPDGNVYKDIYGGIFECASLSDKAYAFDPIHPHSQFQAWGGDFKDLADMPRARARHASAIVNGNICVFGGRNVTDYLIAEVDCYDPVGDEWTTPTSLPEEYTSSDLTAFARGGDVYLVGGYDQEYTALDRVTIVDMSDLNDISYSIGPKLKAERGDIDAAVLENGDVYVSGGFTHENDYANPLNSVEKYDPSLERWSDVGSLNEERGDKQLVALHGKVYAIGGENKVDVPNSEEMSDLAKVTAGSAVLDSVEVLDPSEDVHGGLAEWRSLGGMPGQLFRFGAAEWDEDEGGYVFVFGGQVAYESECECFKTTDRVLVFDVARAEDLSAEALGSGAGVVAFRGLSVAVASLLWFVL